MIKVQMVRTMNVCFFFSRSVGCGVASTVLVLSVAFGETDSLFRSAVAIMW